MSIALFKVKINPPLLGRGAIQLILRMSDAHYHPLGKIIRGITFAEDLQEEDDLLAVKSRQVHIDRQDCAVIILFPGSQRGARVAAFYLVGQFKSDRAGCHFVRTNQGGDKLVAAVDQNCGVLSLDHSVAAGGRNGLQGRFVIHCAAFKDRGVCTGDGTIRKVDAIARAGDDARVRAPLCRAVVLDEVINDVGVLGDRYLK